jgi:hypothetical protein
MKEIAMPETKEWTIMFYFASDNPLAPSTVSQLKAIKDAGFHEDANVIAHFDPHTNDTPPHIFEVNLVNKLKARANGNHSRSNIGFATNDPFVRNLVLDKLWDDEKIKDKIRETLNTKDGPHIDFNPPKLTPEMSRELDPKASLAGFLEFCGKEYPARHYILFIMGHGLAVGNDVFLFDENAIQPSFAPPIAGNGNGAGRSEEKKNEPPSPQHFLTLKDLGIVLNEFKDNHAKLELVGFHSCSMSGVEVAYELQGAANYMLASQGPAFVGSWPYKQMLIRVFNNLDSSSFVGSDIVNGADLVAKFQAGTDEGSLSLANEFRPNTKDLLKSNNGDKSLKPALRSALVNELNDLLDKSDLHKRKEFQVAGLAGLAQQVMVQNPVGADLRWLNRMLLTAAFPNELKEKEKPTIRGMLVKFFYYALYNSYDFQLAGYSFDLALCDLDNVKNLKDSIVKLSSSLRDGLDDWVAQNLILLAHWESQSYYTENYTDLFDFCQRLEMKCADAQEASKTTPAVKALRTACGEVMSKLAKGVKSDADTRNEKIIVRSEFAGPLYQFSRGLSVLFPWCEPSDRTFWEHGPERKGAGTGYKGYIFEETEWSKFLDDYFVKTQRKSQNDSPHTLERDLLEEITAVIFNENGQLKHGPLDGMGLTKKHGATDTNGADCDCPTIKNFPGVTRDRPTESGDVSTKEVPISPNFHEGFS